MSSVGGMYDVDLIDCANEDQHSVKNGSFVLVHTLIAYFTRLQPPRYTLIDSAGQLSVGKVNWCPRGTGRYKTFGLKATLNTSLWC